MNPRRVLIVTTLVVTGLVTACLAERAVGPEEPLPAVLAVDRPMVQLFRFALGRMVAADTVRLSNNGEGPLGRIEQVGGVDYLTTTRTGWLNTSVVELGEEQALLILRPTYAEKEQEEADVAEVVLKAEGSPELKRVTVIARTIRGASFEFSVSPLAFATAPGDPPSSQTITVRNGGNGALLIHSPRVRFGGEEEGWLAVTPAGGTNTAPEFQVQVDPNSLGGGLYKAYLDFESPPGEETRAEPASLEVLLDVSQPRLGISSSTQGFTVVRGGPNPSIQTILLSNAGAGPFESLGALEIGPVSYGPGGTGWLEVALEGREIQVGVEAADLEPADYTATFPVNSQNGGSSTIQVILAVEAPILTASSRAVSFGVVVGDAEPPAPDTVDLTNTGSGSPASLGQIALGALDPPVPWITASLPERQVVLTPSASALSQEVGTHRTILPIESAFGGNDTITVTLSVSPGQDQALLTLSPAGLEFSGIRGDPSPTPQTVQISNAGGGSLGTVSLGTITYLGQRGWLTAVLADSTLTLSVTTGTLPQGSHVATVPVTSLNGGDSEVEVTFSVGAPVLTASATSASFSAAEGDPAAPPPQAITLSNTGPGSFASLGTISAGPVIYQSGSGWLSASLVGSTLTLSVGPPGAAGTLAATVPVTSDEGGDVAIDVSYSVARSVDDPILTASPGVVRMDAIQGGADPSDQSVILSNSGGGDLGALSVFDISYGAGASGWLAATLVANTAALEGTTGSLSPGSYDATVTFRSANGGDASVAVAFEVGSPVLTVSSASASFSAVQGGSASPGSIPITISNTGTGDFSSLGTVTQGPPIGGGGGWLSANLPNGSNTITLTASANALGVGTYADTVPVTSDHGGGDSIAVTLTVTPQTTDPQLVLSADTVSYFTQTGVDPHTQRVFASNSGGGGFSDLGTLTWDTTYVSGTAGWLLPSLSADTLILGATSVIGVNDLPDGTYTADVTVQSAGNGSETVRAVLTIAATAGGPDFELGTPLVSFGALLDGPDPDSRAIPVINIGSPDVGDLSLESLTYGSGATGWLDVSLSQTEVTLSPQTDQVSSAGTFTAWVVVKDADGAEKDSVNVSFEVGQAVLTFENKTVSFDGEVSGGDPPDQIVAIANTGDGSYDGLEPITPGTIVYDPAEHDWLDATVGSEQATLEATSAGLSVGVYNATVPFSSTTGGSDTLKATFTVRPAAEAAELALSASEVAFVAVTGASSPAPKSVNLFNSGGGTESDLDPVTVSVVGGPPAWLPTPQRVGSTIIFSPSTTGLGQGSYAATVEVQSSGGTETVQVDLEVSDPILTASTTGLSFTGLVGGGSPSPQTVGFSNTGAGVDADLGVVRISSKTYVGGTTGWISSPSVGEVLAGNTFDFAITLAGLSSGSYTGTVVASSDHGGDQSIAVTLSVVRETDPPRLVLSTTTQRFDALVGGGNPETQVVLVSNGGGGGLGTVQSGPATYGPGGTGWITHSVNGNTITVQALTGNLEEGDYTAQLPVSSQNGGTDAIDITFVVGSPQLTVAPRTVTFGDTVGGTGPDPVRVAIANTGGGTFSSLGSVGVGSITYQGEPSGWLTVDHSAPESLDLTASTGGLSARATPYQALFLVSSTFGGADTVTVLLTIAAGGSPPELSLSLDSMAFSGLVGAEDPPTQSVAGFNSGGGSLGPLSIEGIEFLDDPGGWLTGSVSGAMVTLQPTVFGLPGGTHRAVVSVGSEYGGSDDLAVALNLAEPLLSLSSRTVTFSDTVGSPDTLQSQVFISNVGGGNRESLGVLELGAITFSGGESGWLQTDPPGESTIAGNSITLNGVASNLPEGSWMARVPVLSEWGGSDTVSVTFAAREPDRSFDLPTIEFVKDTLVGGNPQVVPLAGDSVGATAPGGSTAQIAVRVGVRNASETRVTLSGLRVGIPTYPDGQAGGWITGAFLDRTTATFSEPAELFVAVDPSGLSSGRYEGRLVVSSETAGLEEVAPRVLRVILSVG